MTSAASPVAARKKLLSRLAAVQKLSDATKKAAKLAKAGFKTAKQKFKEAKRAAKKHRKEIKALKAELASVSAKKKPAKKAASRSTKPKTLIAAPAAVAPVNPPEQTPLIAAVSGDGQPGEQ